MRSTFPGRVVRVLVTDDTRVHTELVVKALRRDPCLHVLASASDSEAFMSRVNSDNVQIVLIGTNLGEQPGSGFEVMRSLRKTHTHIPGVMLLNSSKSEVALEAFRAGARGVFSREEPVERLSKCVRRVFEGQIWANNEQISALVAAWSYVNNVSAVNAEGVNLLTKREAEIVRAVAQGLTNRAIAEQLSLSPHTVKNSLFRIFDKLGVSSRVELLYMTLSQAQCPQPNQSHSQHVTIPSLLDQTARLACRKAAEQGSLVGQLALAEYYSCGDGGPRDALEACKWYSIAKAQIMHNCASLMENMSVDQLLHAERLVTDWFSGKSGRSFEEGTRAADSKDA